MPSVAARLASGTLNLHGWAYKFETADVFAYDGESGQFGKVGARSAARRAALVRSDGCMTDD